MFDGAGVGGNFTSFTTGNGDDIDVAVVVAVVVTVVAVTFVDVRVVGEMVVIAMGFFSIGEQTTVGVGFDVSGTIGVPPEISSKK